MNSFSFGALATVALCASAQATDTAWSGLDQEINSLSASLATQGTTGPKVGGYIITAFDYEADPPGLGVDLNNNGAIEAGTEANTPFIGDDTSGWDFRFVRLQVKGDLGHDYSYMVSFDLGTGSAELEDAFVDWKITDGIQGRWGRYRVPFARSALVSDAKLLFLQRTAIGESLDFRDLGASVSGQFEMVRFWLNVQNGSDGIVKDMFINARVTMDIMGEGVSLIEGAYGASDAIGMSIGGAIGDDTGLDDGLRWLLEAAFVSGPFSFAAEVADFDADVGDNTPWDATASFLFTEQYEIAARYEDFDDGDADTTATTLGLNRYVSGHDIKWTLQYRRIDTDFEPNSIAFDRDQVAVGLTVAF